MGWFSSPNAVRQETLRGYSIDPNWKRRIAIHATTSPMAESSMISTADTETLSDPKELRNLAVTGAVSGKNVKTPTMRELG